MKISLSFSKLMAVVAGLAAFLPSPVFACAACYGRSDSPQAIGMNWGIFTLLGVVVTVLVSIASFFIYIIRKEASQASPPPAGQDLSDVKI